MIRDNKRILLGLLSVLVSAGLVVWLLARIDLSQTADLLSDANWGWLLLAAFLTCALPFTSVFRWLGVLRAQDTQLPFFVALRAVMMANVLNSFLPSKSGGRSESGLPARTWRAQQGDGDGDPRAPR